MLLYTFNSVMRTMSDGVPGVVFAGVAIIIMFIGLVMQQSSLMMIAAILTFPFTYTMGGGSGIFLAIRFLPLLQLGSAFAISKKEMMIAWVAPIIPFLLLVSFLFKVIVAQLPK